MSCSPFELKDYFLKELPDFEGRQVEAHVKTCEGCREELDRLRFTESALFALRDEEIPQRIAFVSDKVFEPSRARRFWDAFWMSTSRLGFAAAAALAIAMVARPVRIIQSPVGQAPAPVVQTVSDAEIQSRVKAEVAKAVGQVEIRQAAQTKQLMAELDDTRKWLQVTAAEYEQSQKRLGVLRAASYRMPETDGEVK